MVEPYLNLEGRALEAITFYETVFDGVDKRIALVKDMPQNPDYPIPAELADKVAHAQMVICGTMFNFSDMQPSVTPGGPITLMIRFDSTQKVSDIFNKLLDGGYSLMELSPQPYAKLFGWVADKFGIGWQLICE
jgi:PhnB protein